jgi:putative flippase GtrA
MKSLPRYVWVSLIALIVDYFSTVIFVTFVGLSSTIGVALGYSLGAVVSYFLSVYFVFEFRRFQDSSGFEAFLYLGMGVVGLLITEIVVIGSEMLFGMPYWIAKLPAVGLSFIATYILRYYFLFLDKAEVIEEHNE